MREYVFRVPDDAIVGVFYDRPDAPTELVRCRDCDFFETDRLGERCTLMEFRTVGMANGFCAWGKRRATLADLYGVWREDR